MSKIIIGAGHAAGQAAASLRQEGYEGPITIFGEEPHIPYQRPPLSKQYLSVEQGIERVYLRPEKFYADKDIVIKTSTRVSSLDPVAHTIGTESGETFNYEILLIATGSRARRLNAPGSDLKNIFYLRTIQDVDSIRSAMNSGNRLAIVGGGYVGLEVASVGRAAGLEVHVIEMEDRILQRVTTPEMSAYYHDLPQGRGVTIHTKTLVEAFLGDNAVSSVKCDNQIIEADLVVVGIGIIPNTELAEKAGIECNNGILVNEQCLTSMEDIYSAGDCTNHPNPILKRRLRLESVPNAMEQARVAAANMCGLEKTYASIPWFWSDQYELKLQMVGFSDDGDEHITRGNPSENMFAVFHLKNGSVVAADAVNSAKEFMVCKQLIGKPVDAKKLADPEIDLKSLL